MPYDQEFHDSYENIIGNDDHYAEFQDIWDSSGIVISDHQMELEAWGDFLHAFYPEDDVSAEDWQERRSQFYEETGIGDEDIDWDAWREIVESISGEAA